MYIFFSITLISCETLRPKGKTEAEILYKEALELVKDKRYILAQGKLNTIRSKFQYSYFSTHAELLSADILFQQENFSESAAAYIVFKNLHPKHLKYEYVSWKIGESFFKQLPSTFDRDLSACLEAVKYYKEYIRNFPKGRYLKDSKSKIKSCEYKNMQKEKYIASFYMRRKIYRSALYRYFDIIKRFSDKDLKSHAMIGVIHANNKLGNKSNCTRYYNIYKRKISKSYINKLEKAYKKCV